MNFATVARITILMNTILGSASTAFAAPAAVIFPFEIYDTSGEPPPPDIAARLAMSTRVLSDALEKTGRYAVVDLAAFSAEIAALGPRYQCSSCFRWLNRSAVPHASADGLP